VLACTLLQKIMMGGVGSTAVVLLCAEEDDLELVRWVHAARGQGLAPEVVTGIERDDGPMLEAIAQTGEALFVVLRSDNLSAERMREIKTAFARHHRGAQRLVALRLDATAEAAVERIAKQIAGGMRGRSETSLTMALEDVVLQRVRHGTGSHPAIVASRMAREQSEVRASNARASDVAPVTSVVIPEEAAAPSVPTALEWARVAEERATTQRYSIDDETLPMPVIEPSTPKQPRASAGRVPAMIAGLVLAIGAASGITWWLLDATAPVEAPREVVPAAESGRVSVPKAAEDPADAPVAREIAVEETDVVVVPSDAPRVDEDRSHVEKPRKRTRAQPSTQELPAPPPVVAEPVAAAAPAVEGETIPAEPAPLENEVTGAAQ
jgi:hypothetical protein